MPLYFGLENKDKTEVSVALSARGINYLRASPSDLDSHAKFMVPQPNYQLYKANLAAFMVCSLFHIKISVLSPVQTASQNGHRVPLDKAYYPLYIRPDLELFPLPPVDLTIRFTTPIPSETIELLRQGNGFETKKIRGKDVYTFLNPAYEDVLGLIKLKSEETTPATEHTINISAYRQLRTVTRIFTIFLLTHSYPGFHADKETNALPDLFQVISKRVRADSVARPRKKSKGKEPAEETMEDEDRDGPTDVAGEQSTDAGTRIFHAGQRFQTNIIIPNNNPFGPVANVPNNSGMVFPFVLELAKFDFSTVIGTIRTYFYFCLGPDGASCAQRLDSLREKWPIIAKTNVGHMLAHLAKGIEFALESQTVIYPMFEDGVYQGFVLSGAQFAVWHHRQLCAPLSFEGLQADLSAARMHGSVLKAILELAGTMDDDEVPRSMRMLRDRLLTVAMTEETKDAIKKMAYQLSFPQRYYMVNGTTLSDVLDMLVPDFDPLADIGTGVPMHPSALFTNDRIMLALSAFGYNAPSFNIPYSPKCPLSKVERPKKLVVRMVPLHTAVTDFKMMLETKSICNDPKTLSGKFNDKEISKDYASVVWGTLRKVSGAINESTVSNPIVGVAGPSGFAGISLDDL